MQTIKRFILDLDWAIQTPKGSQVISVMGSGMSILVFAVVEEGTTEQETHSFAVYRAGEPLMELPDGYQQFIDTIKLSYTFHNHDIVHIFEILPQGSVN